MSTPDNIFDMVEASSKYDEGKVDYAPPASLVSFDHGMNMHLPPSLYEEDSGPLFVEDHALSHLCTRLAQAPYGKLKNARLPYAHYRRLRDVYPDLVSNEFNQFVRDLPRLRHGDAPNWFVRTHGTNVRAVLTPSYTSIPNTDLLQMASKIFESVGQPDMISPYVGRDGFIAKSIVRWGPHPERDGDIGFGYVISNNETGNGSAVVEPVVQFTSCTNSIVAQRDEYGERMGLRLQHRGNAATKVALLQAAIVEVLPQAEHIMDQYVEASGLGVGDLSEAIGKLGQRYGWGEDVRLAVAAGTNGKETKAGLVDGITYAAHTMDLSPDAQLAMEKVGGEFLFGKAAGIVQREEAYVSVPR